MALIKLTNQRNIAVDETITEIDKILDGWNSLKRVFINIKDTHGNEHLTNINHIIDIVEDEK